MGHHRRARTLGVIENDVVCMVFGVGQEWWRENRNEFPKLILVMREVMMVPASTARLERCFIKRTFFLPVLCCQFGLLIPGCSRLPAASFIVDALVCCPVVLPSAQFRVRIDVGHCVGPIVL